ncbi:MAG: DNA helicase II / ATP-dependent DNA helicase PcrA [Parcubacteria group bacterium LiPW_15]|nr:MAG: DNA helicase II / ATP-dependent DNA helicase PcrA [Parcubacteria group bacterium LiPW_15]
MHPELNPAQKKAVEAPMRPLLIVAGAGTGKTRTLTSRLIHLINSGVEPDKILALTFTNKAAREMMDRLEGELKGLRTRPLVGTFHSLGARILRAEAEAAGRTKDFVIFDDHDSFDLIKKLIKEMGFSPKEQKPSEFYRYISAIKNGMSAMSETEAPAGVGRATAEEFYKRYEAGLLRHNAFDFDDLLEKLVLVLKNNPEILKRYQGRYQYVLVDEYQDLNNVQYEFLKLLSRDGGNLSVVGDAAQTIYTWRGSNINIFLNFEKDWPGAQITLLEENYRSTSNIIDAASGILLGERTLSPNLKYKLWTKNGEGKAVTLLESGSEEEEAEWIVDKIVEKKISAPAETMAVLYRTNAQSRALEQALLRRGVPYRVFGGMRFYERREIKDVLAGLRYALNRADEISKERLEKSILKTRFRRFEAELGGTESKDPLELIQLFLNSTDYLQYIERSLTDPEERKENIAELIHFASEFKELPPFLEQISLLQSADNLSKRNNSDGLILSTVHLAKGLEFDTVFISGVKEGLMPHARSFYDPESMEEERRLLYVAMTRARKELYLCFYEIPSRFLSAIPDANMSYENLTREKFSDFDSEERYISYD